MSNDTACTSPNRPYLLGTRPGEPTAVLIRPRCNNWSCPACAEIKKSEWFLHALKGGSRIVERGEELAMVTLTARGGKRRSFDKSLADFKRAWPRLRKRVIYAQGELSYILIPEQHRDGVMHAHLLLNNNLTDRNWKDFAYRSGLGYMADVTIASSAGDGAYYVSKYIDKHLEWLHWPRGFRRIRTSQDWPRADLEPDETTDWLVFTTWESAIFEVMLLEHDGVRVDVRCTKD